MGSYIECACNGCAECIGCGRKHEYYTYFECDKCGADAEEMFNLEGEWVCEDCLYTMAEKVEE